ncbi:MAG TPA: lytic transglycosylase F, partial [Methylomirabilota bacterium]|nr:lytic transglycosylase F [Methylomirabilota bacterium]
MTAVLSAALACSALLLVLAAPSEAQPRPERTPATTEADELLPADQFQSHRWTDDLDGMRKRRVIRALVVHSKTFYFFDGAQPRGLTYEALKLFEDFLNKKFGTGNLRIHVVALPVARDALLTGLVEGRGDLAAANLSITDERQVLVDFSDPVIQNVREVVVSGPAGRAPARLEDLAGREVYVRRSSSYHARVQALSDRLRRAGQRPVTIRAADENLEDEDILEMVNAGLVGLTVVDQHKVDFWATVFPKIRVHRNLAVADGESIGWAVRKQNPALRGLINEFLATVPEGSATRNVLLRRYLQDNKWARNPTTQEEMRKYRATVAFFRKYAGQYGFDYLMVTAQAYQESRLDQRLRSRAGAVGVMQVKPSTAAGAPIGIRDVTRVDANVHAGVKYLRFILDRYLDDPAMDPVNRGLFAFAAYNAGPARVQGLRRQAAARGLDPNRWF